MFLVGGRAILRWAFVFGCATGRDGLVSSSYDLLSLRVRLAGLGLVSNWDWLGLAMICLRCLLVRCPLPSSGWC